MLARFEKLRRASPDFNVFEKLYGVLVERDQPESSFVFKMKFKSKHNISYSLSIMMSLISPENFDRSSQAGYPPK